MMLKMGLRVKQVLLLPLLIAAFWHSGAAENEKETSKKLVTAPPRIARGGVIDRSGTEHVVIANGAGDAMGEWQDGNKVSVSTVACFTLAMAATTGLGAVPFLFVELDPQWAGICNGIAAGVMLAASFDLIQEGQGHGSGSLVVLGILAGSLFLWLCKKFIEQYGKVSMLYIKGAEAAKAILVVGIMTLHSFGEGSGVGVSFAGSKGLSQGILVTLAIAVHNIPEGLAVSMVLASRGVSPRNAMLWSVITSLPQPLVAVPSFIFADAFNKFLPFATGFAAGCMIWMVITEVLPDGFKETSPSHVASAATLSVAFMVALSVMFDHLSQNYNPEDASSFFLSLLFGLGPLLGGCTLVAFALAFHLQHALLNSIASGIAFVLGAWQPFQLLLSSKLNFFPLLFILGSGSAFFHLSSSVTTKLIGRKKTSAYMLSDVACFPICAPTLQSILSCSAVALHALSEGLALGVAMPNAYGLGAHLVLHAFLLGFPRGVAAASCIFGATDSWHISLLSAALIGLVGPLSAIRAMLARIDYNSLDHIMVFACGGLFPCFWSSFRRAVKLDKRKSVLGVVIGVVLASLCLTFAGNSYPEAVR